MKGYLINLLTVFILVSKKCNSPYIYLLNIIFAKQLSCPYLFFFFLCKTATADDIEFVGCLFVSH